MRKKKRDKKERNLEKRKINEGEIEKERKINEVNERLNDGIVMNVKKGKERFKRRKKKWKKNMKDKRKGKIEIMRKIGKDERILGRKNMEKVEKGKRKMKDGRKKKGNGEKKCSFKGKVWKKKEDELEEICIEDGIGKGKIEEKDKVEVFKRKKGNKRWIRYLKKRKRKNGEKIMDVRKKSLS